MAVLKFQNLEFVNEKERVKVYFLRIYTFTISKQDLRAIADFRLRSNAIEFSCSDKKATNKFNQLLKKGFESMVCSLNNVKTVYVHRNSGIPLIGTNSFGLIDRNTNCIEVKPITTCNLNCIFCSVDAGLRTRRVTGYVVEEDYLVDEFNKLIESKKQRIEAHIGPQGEPLLYAPIVELVRDLKKNPKVKVISMDTNGTLLNKKLVDELVRAGITRFNISLNSLDERKGEYLAGTYYNLKHLLRMIEYANKKARVLLAPVIVPTINDEELTKLAGFCKKLNPDSPVLGVQNFLNYKRGRNPVKQRSWDKFFKMVKACEKETGARLTLCKEDFGTQHDTKLEKPFKKNQIIKARLVCNGPFKGEKIGVYKNRAIIVDKAEQASLNSFVKVRIVRDKHNIYRGVKQ